MKLRKKILNLLHPLLKPLSAWYLSRIRTYRHEDLTIKIYPGVFHPGLFFSTKILLRYLQGISLAKLKVLELGAGSGLISMYCARSGADVTASDINPQVIQALHENFAINHISARIVQSDLFDEINVSDFDLIVINPPYYPKNPVNNAEFAWYCGDNFQYFKKLFLQLTSLGPTAHVIMILSEDCAIDHIRSLALEQQLSFDEVYRERKAEENNFIFKITA